jgi:hypothetical protein
MRSYVEVRPDEFGAYCKSLRRPDLRAALDRGPSGSKYSSHYPERRLVWLHRVRLPQ